MWLTVTGFGADDCAGCDGIGADAVLSKCATIMKHISLKFIWKYINGGTYFKH